MVWSGKFYEIIPYKRAESISQTKIWQNTLLLKKTYYCLFGKKGGGMLLAMTFGKKCFHFANN